MEKKLVNWSERFHPTFPVYKNIMKIFSGVPLWESIGGYFVEAVFLSFDRVWKKELCRMEKVRLDPNVLFLKL